MIATESSGNGLTALYGGAFDPPHYGHLSVVDLLLSSSEIERVWVVPSGSRPDKESARPASLRLRMTELALAEHFRRSANVSVCDYHSSGKTDSPGTIDLLRYCRAAHPTHRFGIVIGCELVGDLPKWKEAETLRREGFFIITPRQGVDFDERSLGGYSYISLVDRKHEGVQLSSSDIRRKLSNGDSIDGLVPGAVESFISLNSLYKTAED